jgi:NAD(P)H-dependent FMN reductase
MKMKNVVVLSGSIREGRKSHFLACLIFKKLDEIAIVNSLLLDLKDYNFPVMIDTHTEKWPEGMQQFSDTLSKSDGIIIVSPEYKNGIPGALKNALDYLNPQTFHHIPIAIATVSSGGFGGINCLSQLRLVGLALGGIPISEKLCVAKVNEVFYENGNLKDNSIADQISQFVESFLWYVDRLSS